MVKFEGENGIKIANLLSAIRERYGFTYKQSVDYFVRAVTHHDCMDFIDGLISELKESENGCGSMKVETLIAYRLEAKILRMSEPLVLSRAEWFEKGGIYRGPLSVAAKKHFYSAWKCEKIGQPVSQEEFAAAKDFAMFKVCYMENLLPDCTRPCIPVFYRESQDVK